MDSISNSLIFKLGAVVRKNNRLDEIPPTVACENYHNIHMTHPQLCQHHTALHAHVNLRNKPCPGLVHYQEGWICSESGQYK